MEFAPTASVLVLKVVEPPLRVPVPRTVDPALKVTVPVGTAPVAATTLAVKVTEVPNVAGLSDDVTVVVVVAALMVSVKAGEVLVASSVVPL